MKRKKPTEKDLRIASKRASGKTLREIAKEEGMFPNSVVLVLKRVQPELKRALELSNYGLDVAVAKMVEMTNAKKTEYFANQGIVLDKRIVDDNATQLAARREMLRVHGVGLSNGDNGNAGNGGGNFAQFVLNLGFLDPERARSLPALKP